MKTLVIAVHPDDETIGCGGTLLRHAEEGGEIHWVIVTSAKGGAFSEEKVKLQEEQVANVAARYPFASVQWLGFPSTRLETLPLNDMIAPLRDALARVRPEVVFVPNRSDVHSDHRVTFAASMAVLKSFYMATLGVRRVLACEVLSETDAAPGLAEGAFVPNVFVDITRTFARKLEIMNEYQSELQGELMPRGLSSIEALARHRGASIGVRYAEAFMLLREIV